MLHRAGVVAFLVGMLTVVATATGWYWTDVRSRHTAHRLADEAVNRWAAPGAGSPPATGVTGPRIADGVVAVVRIPRLGEGWRVPVHRGTGARTLRRGLGLYTGSPAPGRPGNVALAGHRTTWGAPFRHLDRVRRGDAVLVWTPGERLEYRVTGTGVTVPSDTSVIEPPDAPLGQDPPALLTLTTCHPEFSSSERLYVKAALVGTTSLTAAGGQGRVRA